LVLHAKYKTKDENQKMKDAAEICLECGVCCVLGGRSCHAQYDEQFDPKNTYVYDCLGSDDPMRNKNIWLCVSCHKCEEVCPYDVNPLEFIESIKEKAFESGLAHDVAFNEVEQIISTGYAFQLSSATERQRSSLGLKPLSTKSGEELKILSVKTGLDAKLRKNKEART
jgi:heterodisulfide reductase subunit C